MRAIRFAMSCWSKKFRHLLFICIAQCALALVSFPTAQACPDIDSLLDVNCDGQVIVATFGDSITYGRGSTTGLGYPEYLNQLVPNVIVYNFGNPGENTYSGKSRAPGAFATAGAPDFAVVLEGVNDYWVTNRDSHVTRANLVSILNSGQVRGAIPVLANLTDIRRASQRGWVTLVNSRIQTLKSIDFFSLGVNIISPDNIHPHSAGYQLMAALVLMKLQEATVANRPADTDADGIYDFAEAKFGSSPTNPDSDGDGLLDGAEVFTYGSDPTKLDSDGDGFTDPYEVNTLHTSPGDPRPNPPTLKRLEIMLP